jgi:hypothetical protein
MEAHSGNAPRGPDKSLRPVTWARTAWSLALINTTALHALALWPFWNLQSRRVASVCDVHFFGPDAELGSFIALTAVGSMLIPWWLHRQGLLRLRRRAVRVLDQSSQQTYRDPPSSTWQIWSLPSVEPNFAGRCATRWCLMIGLMIIIHLCLFIEELPIYSHGSVQCSRYFPEPRQWIIWILLLTVFMAAQLPTKRAVAAAISRCTRGPDPRSFLATAA